MAQNKAFNDKVLSGVSNAYIPMGYVADQFLPMVGVGQDTGKIKKYGNGHLRLENSLAGGESQYRRVAPITRSTDTYSLDGHGFYDVLTESDRRNFEEDSEAERDLIMGLKCLMLTEKEVLLAKTVTDNTLVLQTEALAGANQWSDPTSDALAPILRGHDAIEDAIGFKANTLTVDSRVYRRLKFHPLLLSNLGFTQNRAGGLTGAEMAHALEVDRILISDAKYNAAAEGQADDMQAIWGKHAVLSYTPMAAGPYQQSAGYRFQMRSKAPDRIFRSPVDNPPESEKFLIDNWYSMHISNVNAMYLITDTIA